ncbi:MAG: M23 family metallopeptidase [Verrucomicrobiae bacterium]|nr:M23 family metallopeptidase [Verrucomicrobiae bacterium]
MIRAFVLGTRLSSLSLATLVCGAVPSAAQPFLLPTANRALFEPGGEERFLVGTVGRTWTSGGFGCVRSEGWQLHEGLDIRSLQRDKHGEPTDPILATADGTVVYANRKPSLSNYGTYLVLMHRVEGLQIYSLYAHLSEIRPDLLPGRTVRAGESIAVMGRTANTREGISKDRAHLHFELNFLLNDRFPSWYKQRFPDQRNDHGAWNGQNLLGLDPQQVFQEQQRRGAKFSLLHHIRSQTELCRVFVNATDFPWLKRYPALIRANPKAQPEGVAGYEIALNFNAIPFELIPRATSEIKGSSKIQLLSVNEAEQKRNPCRRLVTKRGTRWELTSQGQNALELLTY